MPDLEAVQLRKSIGRGLLFAGSFTMQLDDSPVRLAGPNGVGKSTFLRMLAGLDVSFTGDVRWDGVSARKRLDVAMVPESGLLFPNMTLVAQRQWVQKRTRAAEPWWPASYFDLGDLATLYPFEMSTGQRRKATISLALSVESSLVLFDESWLGLDVVAKADLDDLIVALVDDGRSVIYVSHEDRPFETEVAEFGDLWDEGSSLTG